MGDREELERSLRDEIRQCEAFLSRVGPLSSLAAAVQRRKQNAQARLDAIGHIPDEVLDEVAPQLRQRQDQERKRLEDALPVLPSIDVLYVRRQITSSSLSSDSELVSSIIRVNPGQAAWYPAFIEPLSRLAEDEGRDRTILEAFSHLNPALRPLLETAISTAQSAKGGVASIDLASQHMRGALEKVWGDLCDRARTVSSRIGSKRLAMAKPSDRAEVAKSLATDHDQETRLQELLQSISALHSDLSSSAKNPFLSDRDHLEDITTRWKLHLFNLAEELTL